MADVRIDDHTKEYLEELDGALEKALTEIGIHIEGEAKEELESTPKRIDTGLLRNSISYALDGEAPAIKSYSADNASKYGKKGVPSGSYSGTAPKEGGHDRSVIIGTNVEYGIYVHEGTSRMTANRFLKNAVEHNKDQIKQWIENAMS